jgi:hypothetical protein
MIAVGDAKRWDRNLDMPVKEGADALSNKNPSYQIAFYMQQSGATWGILTNGRVWRLYHKDTAHRLDRFYEVDLVALAEAGDAEAFLYFVAFFSRTGFDDGPLGLAEILRASTDYARAVGESLKAQVYDALRHLAQGFLDYPANRLSTDPATLKQIYDNSLIVLYRLLFVLYAEARELLPVRESSDYLEEYSLKSLSREIARRVTAGTKLLPTTSRLWPRLRDLFGIIHAGSPPLKVATFNGGLFDPARHPFLEQHGVGDAHLQQALDRLARVDGQFIDYRDLAERHLGTIYEGLLEYHLEPIERESEWTVAIVNDKGERHRTGSYYTPDFVVQYIVDQTLGPVLRRAVDGKTTDAEKVQAVRDEPGSRRNLRRGRSGALRRCGRIGHLVLVHGLQRAWGFKTALLLALAGNRIQRVAQQRTDLPGPEETRWRLHASCAEPVWRRVTSMSSQSSVVITAGAAHKRCARRSHDRAGDEQQRRASGAPDEHIGPAERRLATRLELDQTGKESGRGEDCPGQGEPRDLRQAGEATPDQYRHQQQGAGTSGEPNGLPGDVANGDRSADPQTSRHLVDETHANAPCCGSGRADEEADDLGGVGGDHGDKTDAESLEQGGEPREPVRVLGPVLVDAPHEDDRGDGGYGCRRPGQHREQERVQGRVVRSTWRWSLLCAIEGTTAGLCRPGDACSVESASRTGSM